MTLRKVFIHNREFLPEVARITGASEIFLNYEFEKSKILGQDVCVVEIELTKAQAKEIDISARQMMTANARTMNDG